MSYIYKYKKFLLLLFFAVVSYNLYFLFLLWETNTGYLFYLDVLLAAALAVFFSFDAYFFYKNKKRKECLLQLDSICWQELQDMEGSEIAAHDVEILQKQLAGQFDLNCDLQDYMAKWCHEVKIPLSAALLMNENIKDVSLRSAQKEQLERIRQQLNAALLGVKVQSRLFDLQVRKEDLPDCVKTSVHNNQYFLIQKQFQIDLQIPKVTVYTDKLWLVYILDQLVQNAIKYAGEHPRLKIYAEEEPEYVRLYVEDNGEGIMESDIRRVFERGYTGSSHHNGQYKSTGMGLYLADAIVKRLEHTIEVESVYGEFTRFIICIRKILDINFI